MYYYWDIVLAIGFATFIVAGIAAILLIQRLGRLIAEATHNVDEAEEAHAEAQEAYAKAKEYLDHLRVVDHFLSLVAAESAVKFLLYRIRVHEPWIDTMGDLEVKIATRRRDYIFHSRDFKSTEEHK